MRQRPKRKRIYRKKSEIVQSIAFPGYPHYPQSEDVMMTSAARRTDLDVEKLPERISTKKTSEAQVEAAEAASSEAAEKIPKDSELTKDDLAALGPENADMDGGDDEIMALSGDRYDRTGDDLDVPGAELDDENEKIGEEDEENNYYSLGGEKEEDSNNSP